MVLWQQQYLQALQEADILSFKTQSQMSFQLTETEIPTTTSLTLEVNSVQHTI